jgi:hypothetical protein
MVPHRPFNPRLSCLFAPCEGPSETGSRHLTCQSFVAVIERWAPGITLFVSTYNSSGDLTSVRRFGRRFPTAQAKNSAFFA